MPKTPINEQMLQSIWMASRQRRRPWALVDCGGGKLQIHQADTKYEGELLGIYDKPTLTDLREDLAVRPA